MTLLTIADMASEANVSERTVRWWLSTGRLQGERMGGRLWVVQKREWARFRKLPRPKPGLPKGKK